MIMQFDILIESILHSDIPQQVIDSMMENRPSHIAEQDYLETTIQRLEDIVWLGPVKVTIPLSSLAR